jgi:hypothetical protein
MGLVRLHGELTVRKWLASIEEEHCLIQDKAGREQIVGLIIGEELGDSLIDQALRCLHVILLAPEELINLLLEN